MANFDLSVVIPAYNEAKRIVPTITSVYDYLRRNNIRGEIIVVDDGSTDATAMAVTGLVDQFIRLPHNTGKGAAVRKGVLSAKGKDILVMDADGSAPITALADLYHTRGDADIAIGSRHLSGSVIHVRQSLIRQLLSYGGNLFIKLILRLPYADTQCGFKLFSHESAEAIFSQAIIDRWGFDVEILKIAQLLGYKTAEVPIAWHDAKGSSLRAGRAAIYTFEEVVSVWLNVRMGKYRRINSKNKGKS